jgi:hypothetical protein
MVQPDCSIPKGSDLFRKHTRVYLNPSHEPPEYCDKIHKHDFIEIAYVTFGTGLHIVADHQYTVTPGDLFIINYDVPHGFFRLSGAASPAWPSMNSASFLPRCIANTKQCNRVIPT